MTHRSQKENQELAQFNVQIVQEAPKAGIKSELWSWQTADFLLFTLISLGIGLTFYASLINYIKYSFHFYRLALYISDVYIFLL